MARYWRCRRVQAGVVCDTLNLGAKKKCHACGKLRPAKRHPAHKAILGEMPYEEWVRVFGGVCGICGRPPKEGRRLHRDHDHRTGSARGLLCFRDNSALRTYMTLEWLQAAVAYLERAETLREDVAA